MYYYLKSIALTLLWPIVSIVVKNMTTIAEEDDQPAINY